MAVAGAKQPSFSLYSCNADRILEAEQGKSILGQIVDGVALIIGKIISPGYWKKRLVIDGALQNGIAYKDGSDWFIPKTHYKGFTVRLANGKTKRIYVNINSLHKRTGLTKVQIKNASNLTKLLKGRPKDSPTTLDKIRKAARVQGPFRIRKGKYFNRSLDVMPDGTIYVNPSKQQKVGEGNFKSAKPVEKASDKMQVVRVLVNPQSQSGERVTQEEIDAEIHAMKKFAGPGVAKCLHHGKFASKRKGVRTVLFMPRYETDLLELIDKGQTLTKEQIIPMMHHLLIGLARINKEGIHRDIKPDNIFLDKDLNPYIADFGLYQDMDKIKGVSGTPYWVAPEVLNGEDSQKSDVWSMGLVFAILCSNQEILKHCDWFAQGISVNTRFARIKRLKRPTYETPWHQKFNFPEFPQGVADLIKGMLRGDQKDRLTAAQALQQFYQIYPNLRPAQ